MDDLISRQDAKNAIRNKYKDLSIRCEINEVLNSLPSAQRKGEWRPIVLTSYPPKYREMCSCCGFMKNKEAFRFCPICGADMRPDNAPLADDDSIYG